MKTIEKAERTEAKKISATKADVDRTQRLMVVAPVLRELKDEIDSLFAVLEKDPKRIRITFPERNKRRLQEALTAVKTWYKD